MAIAGELLTSVVEGLATTGFRRAYRHVKLAVRRRHVIDRTISGTPNAERDTRLASAINDLSIVIGNARGELTESVAAFIREVERSAIPETLIRCVLTNGDPEAIYPAFQIIYRAFGTSISFNSENFFAALYAAIKLRTEQDVKDPAMLEFVQAQTKELSRQLDEVTRALQSACNVASPLTAQDLNDARLRLARSFEATNRTVTVETLQGAKRCKIKQLVVPPRMETVAAPTKRDTRKAKASLDDDTIAYLQFRTTVSRAVILGDPGGGKSTLTQLLCYDNSNSIMLKSSFPGKPEIDPTELRIPFRIVLRSFDKRHQASPGYNFFSYLVDEIKDIFDNDVDFCGRILRHFLGMGNALVIFDGLDEILEVDRRRLTVGLIEQFTNTYAACPVVVTSRFVGYWDAPVSDDFGVYHLAAFNNDEVSTFAYKLIKIIESLKKGEAEEKAKRFLMQTNNIASDLRENPLMLGLMVYLFIYRGDVPANRPEIYKECATLMFEKWDQRRSIIFQIPIDFDLLDLFSFLASKIFGSADTEDGVSREWLTGQLRIFFEGWYLDKAKATLAAKSLVEFITGRAWVMYDVGPNVFKFTHRTFLEYFFARHLLSSSDSINTLIRTYLLTKIMNSEWDVVAHLALQTAVFRDAGKMSQAADTLQAILDGGFPDVRSRISFLVFVSRSLEYLLLPEFGIARSLRQLARRQLRWGLIANPLRSTLSTP